MNKIIFLLLTVCVVSISAQEKTRFGIATGFLNDMAVSEANEVKITNSEIDFYAGLSADFYLSKNFNIEAQALYYKKVKSISIPVFFKYKASEKLSIILGPQFFINTNETPDDFSAFTVNAVGGLSFDIDKNFALQTTYSYQVSNTYTGSADITSGINYFALGYVFKF